VINAINYLPPADGRNTTVHRYAVNRNIIETLHNSFLKSKQQTAKIAQQFKGYTPEETARNIWNYLRTVNYKKDPEALQMVRLPARFVKDNAGDCKSYSLFAAGVLANLGLPAIFRYASYNNETTPTHVYIVTKNKQGQEIIIDGVYKFF